MNLLISTFKLILHTETEKTFARLLCLDIDTLVRSKTQAVLK